MPKPTLLDLRDLTVRYAGDDEAIVAVDGVSFRIAPGETVGVLGESGSGKTSLARAIPGLLPPEGEITAGDVLFRGRSLPGLAEKELRRLRGREVGLVFQEPDQALHPTRRIGAQIAEVLRAHGLGNRRSRRLAAAERLVEVGLDPEEHADAFPHELSGGQRQRVVIAQALACRPALVLADEPTAALDAAIERQILHLLARLVDELGAALLLISHDPRVHAAVADRLRVMHAGRVVEEGRAAELLKRPRHPVTAELLRSVPSARGKSPARDSTTPINGEAALVRTAALTKHYRRRSPAGRRGQVAAVRGVDLEIRAGTTLAVVGASGSGKSTLARCLTLHERPTTGEIFLDGRPVSPLGRHELRAARPRLQLIFQDPAAALDPRFTAIEAVAEPLRIRGVPRQARRRRAEELFAEVGLSTELAERGTAELSGGQKRRLTLARALAAEAELLIFDEGLAGLDLPLQAQIVGVLEALQVRHGLTYVLITHDLRMVAHLADEVAVMAGGKVVETGEPAALLARPRHAATRELVEAAFGEVNRRPPSPAPGR